MNKITELSADLEVKNKSVSELNYNLTILRAKSKAQQGIIVRKNQTLGSVSELTNEKEKLFKESKD